MRSRPNVLRKDWKQERNAFHLFCFVFERRRNNNSNPASTRISLYFNSLSTLFHSPPSPSPTCSYHFIVLLCSACLMFTAFDSFMKTHFKSASIWMCVNNRIGNRRICRGHVQRSNDDSQRPDEDRLTDQSALQSICRLFVRRCQSNDYVDSWRFTRGRSIDDVVLITFVQFRIEFDEPFWIVGHPIPISQPAERRCHYIDQQF